jgi:hypothetical protein
MLLSATAVNGQVHDEDIWLKVLEKGVVDSLFVFGKWNGEKGENETQLRYLGEVTTKKGRTFKVMNSHWIWGLAHRGTSRILFFDTQNRYIGDYYVDVCSLPDKLENGKLVFLSSKGCRECEKSTTISLLNGIPKQIHVNCSSEGGDYFLFSSD